jgi:hypothetical protein
VSFFSHLFREHDRPRSRVNQINRGIAALEAGDMDPEEVQREIDGLIKLRDKNNDIRAMAGTDGWLVIEEAIVETALDQLRNIAKTLIIDNDVPKARAMAAYILFADALLSGVSEPLLASARVDRLLRTRLTMQEIFERESNARI